MSPKATPAPERKPRLSLSEILALVLTRGGHDRSSVTLTRNAKGETQIEVTVRTGDSSEVAAIADAEREAQDVYDRLRAAYPLALDTISGSGVTLTRNAKGETQIDVTARVGEGPAVESLDALVKRARTEYDRLRAAYPMASGYTGVTPSWAVEPAESTTAAAKGPDDDRQA